MTTTRSATTDVEALQAAAAQAEQLAEAARTAERDRITADAQSHAARELEWRRHYLDSFDLGSLQQEIAEARSALTEAVVSSDLGRALLRLAIAERAGYSERNFAANTALMAGIDPQRLVGFDPQVTPLTRNLTDVVSVLTSAIATAADDTIRQHEVKRQQALDHYASDHGRLVAQSAHVEVIRCAACARPVAPDAVAYSAHGLPFHDTPACKPKPQFPDHDQAAELARDDARRRQAG